jgi:predicted 3-demethylubiquinone-9 3-methyltransferase (glyoxalase superfamily)
MMNPKQKITPFLWFDNNAEEAMNPLCLDLQELAHRASAAQRSRGPRAAGVGADKPL